jgi:glutathione synthase/RimK-type ligase-like ATP-grasp enzyme
VDRETSYLIEALERRGIRSSVDAWDDPTVDWSRFDLAVNRTTSNYMFDPQKYLEWARRAEKETAIWNPRGVLEWNIHKGYLLKLRTAGVPIPPTILIKQGSEEPLGHHLDRTGWDEFVVKPAVTAGSFGLRKYGAASPEAERHFRELNREGYVQAAPDGTEYRCPPCDTIVQEYQPEIVEAGESSLIYFGGEYSHAMIKSPGSGDFRCHPMWGAEMRKHQATRGELNIAEAALNAVGEPTEYARIDILETKRGPVIIEVELIEPNLFFNFFPKTVESFSEYIAAFVLK